MNRNIVTWDDAIESQRSADQLVGSANDSSTPLSPSAEKKLGGARANQTLVPDTWNERLIKYMPAEAMGFYLALDKAVHTSEALRKTGNEGQLLIWLIVMFLATLLFNISYLIQVWKIQKIHQIIISSVALVSYVYVLGGPFALLGWSDPSAQLIVVVLTTGFLIFFDPINPATNRSRRTSASVRTRS